MEPTQVQSADDILAAADARLNAPVQPITTPAAKLPGATPPKPDPDAPAGDEPDPDGEGDDGDSLPGPDEGGEPTPDGEPRLTAAEIKQLRAQAAKAAKLEQQQLALEHMLANPEEYAKMRRARGLDKEPAAPPVTPPANTGPDPVDNAQGWKYERYNAYVEYLQSQGKTATPQAIMAQVEQDHVHARTDRMHEIILEDRKERAQAKADQEKRQGEWRQDQEASAIARTLTPLFKAYPAAATPEGQKDVEAHIIRAIHLGEKVDYEAIVRRVAGTSRAAVKDWAQKKRALGTATAPAAGRGGSAQGSRAKLVDRLPADTSSFSAYAEARSRGEV